MTWKYKVGDYVEIVREEAPGSDFTNLRIGDVSKIVELYEHSGEIEPCYKLQGEKTASWYWLESELNIAQENSLFDGMEALL